MFNFVFYHISYKGVNFKVGVGKRLMISKFLLKYKNKTIVHTIEEMYFFSLDRT